MPAGMRPSGPRYHASARTSVSVHSEPVCMDPGFASMPGHPVREEQRRLGHAHLTTKAVLRRERRAPNDVGDATRGRASPAARGRTWDPARIRLFSRGFVIRDERLREAAEGNAPSPACLQLQEARVQGRLAFEEVPMARVASCAWKRGGRSRRRSGLGPPRRHDDRGRRLRADRSASRAAAARESSTSNACFELHGGACAGTTNGLSGGLVARPRGVELRERACRCRTSTPAATRPRPRSRADEYRRPSGRRPARRSHVRDRLESCGSHALHDARGPCSTKDAHTVVSTTCRIVRGKSTVGGAPAR